MEAEWRPAKNWCEGSQLTVTFCHRSSATARLASQGELSTAEGKFAGWKRALREALLADIASMRVSVRRAKRPMKTSLRQRRSARMGEPSARVKMWCGVTSSDSLLEKWRRM